MDQPNESAIDDNAWVPLGVAFSHALAVEEARLGVRRSRKGVALGSQRPPAQPWRPSSEELEQLLRENALVEVDSPAHKRKKKILKLTEIATTAAHSRLMAELRKGKLCARGRWTGDWVKSEQPRTSSHHEILEIPKEFWISGKTSDGNESSPIPNYSTGVSLDGAVDINSGFWGTVDGVELRLVDILSAIGARTNPDDYPTVQGGDFRKNGSSWTISCGGETAEIPHRIGMAYLAVLLAHPNERMLCSTLYTTGRAVANGTANPDCKLIEALHSEISTTSPQQNAKNSRNENETIALYKSSLRTLRKQLVTASENRRPKIENEIRYIEQEISKSESSGKRRDTDQDKYRQRIYHAFDDSFRFLSLKCPAFVRHLGTYRGTMKNGTLEKRRLHIMDGKIWYSLDATTNLTPAWNTDPFPEPLTPSDQS